MDGSCNLSPWVVPVGEASIELEPPVHSRWSRRQGIALRPGREELKGWAGDQVSLGYSVEGGGESKTSKSPAELRWEPEEMQKTEMLFNRTEPFLGPEAFGQSLAIPAFPKR